MHQLRVFVVSLALALALLAGCAVGQKITYDQSTPSLRASAPLLLAVAVEDRRPEIGRDNRLPTFVGVLRAGFGNAWPLATTSGNPLADDFADTVVRGLAARGFRATKVAVNPDERPEQVVGRLARTGMGRLLLLQLTAWKSDTYMNTALIYNVNALVLDVPQARILGQSRVAGRDDLGGSAWNPGAHAKEAVPPAYQKKLEALLNAPSIVDALAATPPVPPAPAPAPSPPPPAAPTAISPPNGPAVQ